MKEFAKRWLPDLFPAVGALVNPWLLTGAAVALVSAFLYGVHLEAGRFEAYRDQVATVTASIEAVSADHAKQSAALVKQLETDHAAHLAQFTAGWTAELDRVRRAASRRVAAKPVRIDTKVCDDEDGNRRLSDALQRAEQELGAAVQQLRVQVASYQARTGRLLDEAQKQTLDLDTLKAWAQREREINAR